MDPVTLEIALDLDAYLVRFRGYNQDGEEMTTPQTMEEIVLDRAATLVTERAVKAENDAYRTLRSRVEEVTAEEIRARVVPLVEEAIAQPFRRTNSYGEATGAETTLRDEVIRVATDYLTKPPRDSYSREKGTAVEQFIAGEVKKAIDAELREALNEAKAQVAAAVQGQAAELLQQTITRMAGVRP